MLQLIPETYFHSVCAVPHVDLFNAMIEASGGWQFAMLGRRFLTAADLLGKCLGHRCTG